MKKIIPIFAVLLLISCSAVKDSNMINHDSKEKKHVLIFLNNTSKKHILDEIKNEIIDASTLENVNPNLVFHTEKKEGIVYDFGLELLIKEIIIYESEDLPTIDTNYAEISNTNTFTDLNNQNTVNINQIIPLKSEIIETQLVKQCFLTAELNLLNLKSGALINNKPVNTSKKCNTINTEYKGDDIKLFINPEHYNNVLNIRISNKLNKIYNKTEYTSKNKSSKKLPSDILLVNETALKLKNHYIDFLKNI